ncbi:glycogen/starch/alpha-glucan phosphorylase [Tepidiphilus olei]|uniref:glycogen/starch/alpha-glucan phosphorylase n=1 Tax=Tepidiphilus olei TaxID=2502184 RepID=UPI00115F58CF|nr:glycogen/starch/alpha-glucan phosphorylase [Tepidiphilus olei]
MDEAPAVAASGGSNHWLERIVRRTGRDAPALQEDFLGYLYKRLGRSLTAEPFYQFRAFAYTLADRLMLDWQRTWNAYHGTARRKAFFVSMEFLIGRSLGNALLNLGVEEDGRRALEELGQALDRLEAVEPDAGLGNGGLGRLAACMLDSCATQRLPVLGYGLRYNYGMFRQIIRDGWQIEEPDHWLKNGAFPWETPRPEYTRTVRFGGRTHHYVDPHTGWLYVHWDHDEEVQAVPYDVPIPGYRNGYVATLRLWSSSASEEFNLSKFNEGDYYEAVDAKNAAENITLVLYPNDASESGKELRLRQHYFLASASAQDVVQQWVAANGPDFKRFAEFHVFQINDTHPSFIVPELMRLFIDEYHLGWEEAWGIVTHCVAYTNHTLLPEALETWPAAMVQRVLPRVYEIIAEIDRRFALLVHAKWPNEPERHERMAILSADGQVRMAHLAVVGSFSVNGVSALHGKLLVSTVLRDHAELWPQKFHATTNGVTPRRWIARCNPQLRALLDEALGPSWITDASRLHALEDCAEQAEFRRRWREIKQHNKERLAERVLRTTGIEFSPDALFDVQVKRIHEYKRQLLNVLHVIHLYDRIKRGDAADWTPRCVLFAGKAAPGYAMAKKIVKLINDVARIVALDPDVGSLLKVAFLPDYDVSTLECIAPAAELSEQIPTIGKEASGTGNMKLMMNGALTIGTLDGANLEIYEAVGSEAFFAFGLSVEEANALRARYDPQRLIAEDEDLRRALSLLESGHCNPFDPRLYDDVLAALKNPQDPWLVLADFRAYAEAQCRAAQTYRDTERWTRLSIRNTARSGIFSVDRTVREYNETVWHLHPVEVEGGTAR